MGGLGALRRVPGLAGGALSARVPVQRRHPVSDPPVGDVVPHRHDGAHRLVSGRDRELHEGKAPLPIHEVPTTHAARLHRDDDLARVGLRDDVGADVRLEVALPTDLVQEDPTADVRHRRALASAASRSPSRAVWAEVEPRRNSRCFVHRKYRYRG